ncbi:MAG: type II toxin-antitoxin system RelB/DinJ family antitoxin [Bacilli bacterium]|nr:type II toxin-antitoxin system RelB/DinJ family antitoxin [Bacilli bacterium]
MKKPSKTTINIRIDEDLKNDAEELFSDLGISTTTAITLFFKSVIRTNGLPFAVTATKSKKERKKIVKLPGNTVFENGFEEDDLDLDFDDLDALKNAIDKL